MNAKEFQYNDVVINGFVALFVNLAILPLLIVMSFVLFKGSNVLFLLLILFLLFCLPWMGLRFMGLDAGLRFWQVHLLAALTLFVSNALPNVAGMGSVETAFLLVYGSFLPDAASMSLLMFYRLASYYATFAASAVGFGLAQRRLNRS